MKLLVTLTLIPFLTYANPPWGDRLNLKTIEHQLKAERIVRLIPMQRYLHQHDKKARFENTVYLARLANGLKAVFKPEDKPFLAYGEVAAYRASKWLGSRLVPPTVIKSYRGKTGSLQFFVETPFDLLKKSDRKLAFRLLSDKVKSDMNLFYYVFWGRKTHIANRLVSRGKDGGGYLALIDNAALMQRKARYGAKAVPKPDVYSRATINRYQQLTIQALRWIFKDAIKARVNCCSDRFFRKILKRKDALLKGRKKTFIN